MRRLPPLPPMAVDAIIALSLFALGLQNSYDLSHAAAEQFTHRSDSLHLALLALMTFPLVFRRRFPQTVLALVLIAFVADRVRDYPDTMATAALVLAMHSIGSELPPRRSLILGGGLTVFIAAFTTVGAVRLESVTFSEVISITLLVGVPLVLGREVYQRRRRFEALEDRATAAEREREERARQAVREERTRIARELHDVVAHQMAVVTLQAEGARRLLGGSHPRVAESLDTIRQAGRDALVEMRRMVTLLRSDAATDAGDLAPQPGLGDLDRLVEQMREAGLDVTLRLHGERRPLSGGADLSVYRIVQESLTNTLKHGGAGAHADVTITYHADRLDLEITDDGAGTGRVPDRDADDGSGHGLVGMRERVMMFDGELTAGRLPDGGFRVRATLPLEP